MKPITVAITFVLFAALAAPAAADKPASPPGQSGDHGASPMPAIRTRRGRAAIRTSMAPTATAPEWCLPEIPAIRPATPALEGRAGLAVRMAP